MPQFDLSLAELEAYRPELTAAPDFDAFWSKTLELARSHDLDPEFNRVDYMLETVEVFDVRFRGWNGERVAGWLTLPRHRIGPLPAVVQFIGYGGGRSLPYDQLVFSAAGYAHLVMDTRGQGSASMPGVTPDPDPDPGTGQFPGFMTRGIASPDTYYYRRVMSDAVRAVEAVMAHPDVDGSRVAVYGGSQGGGLALAVAGLVPGIRAAVSDVPFLCHFRRATEITDTKPYNEISSYLSVRRDRVDEAFRTLSYFDGMNFASRADAPVLFGVALMDDICPPSTVYAAYNHYAGPKDIRIWPFNGHESGQVYQIRDVLNFLRQHFSSP